MSCNMSFSSLLCRYCPLPGRSLAGIPSGLSPPQQGRPGRPTEKSSAVVTRCRAGLRRRLCCGSFPGTRPRVGRGAAPVPQKRSGLTRRRTVFGTGGCSTGRVGLCKPCITPLAAMDKPDARPMDKLCITVGLLYTAYPQPAHRLTHGSQRWGVIHRLHSPGGARRHSPKTARIYKSKDLFMYPLGEAPPSSGPVPLEKHLHRGGGAAPRAFLSAGDPFSQRT